MSTRTCTPLSCAVCTCVCVLLAIMHCIPALAIQTQRPEEVYRYGNGFEGSTITLKTDGTYELEYWSDAKDPTDPNNERGKSIGIYTNSIDFVLLTPTDKDRPRRFLPKPTRYVRITWGKRNYLMSESSVHYFRDSVNDGEEPRTNDWGDFALKKGDDEFSAPGLPHVPKPFDEQFRGVKRAGDFVPVGGHYLDRLLKAARAALEAGRRKDAIVLATELLQRNGLRKWDFESEYLHLDGHEIIGLAYLRGGDVAGANRQLILAGRPGASHKLDFESPRMTLAQELLKRGQRPTVIEYLALLRNIWAEGRKPIQPGGVDLLTKWQREIRAGKTPRFNVPP